MSGCAHHAPRWSHGKNPKINWTGRASYLATTSGLDASAIPACAWCGGHTHRAGLSHRRCDRCDRYTLICWNDAGDHALKGWARSVWTTRQLSDAHGQAMDEQYLALYPLERITGRATSGRGSKGGRFK